MKGRRTLLKLEPGMSLVLPAATSIKGVCLRYRYLQETGDAMTVPLVGGKTALQSTTIRAIIVGLLGLLASAGHSIVPADDPNVDTAVQVIGYIIAFGSYIVAWYGRVKATTRIMPSSTITVLLLPLMLAMGLGMGSGCTSRAELVTLRESMYASQRTRNEEHMELVHTLGPGGDRATLPTYTAEDVKLREDNLKAYEDLVQASRDHDKSSLLGRP